MLARLPGLILTAAAIATVGRAILSYLGRRRQHTTSEFEQVRWRATVWLRQAAIHFAGKRMPRTWSAYTLDRYISSLYKRHEKLVVPGRLELPIDRCYIPLELRAGQTTDASQLLAKSGTVLILGDPGTGKSALLSRLVRSLCVSCFEDKDAARVPIYVQLQQLITYLPNQGDEPSVILPNEAFKILGKWFNDFELLLLNLPDSSSTLLSLAQGARNGLVLLLDGLDEINSQDIGRVERFIIGINRYLSTANGQNIVFIGSRRQALEYTPHLLDGSLPNVATVGLSPFSPAAIYSFLLHWPYRSGQNPAAEARRIFTQLQVNPTLLDTCSNPLALALYVNNDLRLREFGQYYGSSQLETRAAFFTEIVDYLLVHRRPDQLTRTTPIRPFRMARASYFVAVVDEHIKSNEQFNHVSHAIMLRHAHNLARQHQSDEQAVFDLAKDTGIILRNSDGTWRFIHRSFLDYFLANALATMSMQAELQQLLTKLRTSPLRYLEGFYLACGLMASRHSTYLDTVLTTLGNNTFVGKYYPRAMLEAQAYFMPSFVERIASFCDLWKRSDRDPELFRDLVSVLIDYENACLSLGRPTEVSVVTEFRDELSSEGTSVLRAAGLNVELAMRVAKVDSIADILLQSSTEDAIVALYDPQVSDRLSKEDMEADVRLAAIVAETALRSPLFAANLVADLSSSDGIQPLHDEPWAQAWPIRYSRFADVLAHALPFVRGLPPARRTEFPHLTILSQTRSIRRLRYELMVGDWRMSLLILSVFVLVMFPFWIIGWSPLALGLTAVPAALLILAVFRVALLRDVVTPRSQRILNLRPLELGSVTLPDQHVRLVSGDNLSLKKWFWRRPRGTDGMITAVYVRHLPFVWRRYCPALDDLRMPRAGCAVVQHFYTEDVRRLVRS